MLHTISNSTIDTALINVHDVVLFWQNGVTLAIKDNPVLNTILAKKSCCYVLDTDLLARGLTSLIDSRVTIVNMSMVVTLTAKYHPQMKW